MVSIFMNTKNNKISEPHKFVLNLSQRLDLRSSDKHVTLQNLLFKIEDGYKPELWLPETMKLFGITKRLIDKLKYGEYLSCLEVAEIILVQCI